MLADAGLAERLDLVTVDLCRRSPADEHEPDEAGGQETEHRDPDDPIPALLSDPSGLSLGALAPSFFELLSSFFVGVDRRVAAALALVLSSHSFGGYLDRHMDSDTWRLILGSGLIVNALLGFGYRVYRLSRGGPMADVVGQAILGVLLIVLGLAATLGAGWPRWPALVYGILFGLVVMPIWTLAILIPLPPGRVDYAFASVYWATLVLIAVAAVAA